MLVITPPVTTAVPKAPVPPPPVILTETKLYPEPPLVIETEPTLYVILNLAPEPIAPIPGGAALVLIVVATFVAPGNAV